MIQESPLRVKVWGEYACFTRPEMKVERVSYPVMTPTAARGVLEAIFWKPEFRWQVEEIGVLKPIQYFSILRNEVGRLRNSGARPNPDTVLKWLRKSGSYFATDDRNQRHTLGLRDVAYVITARQVLRPDVTDDPAKYRDQFRRRVRAGRCFATPYLGCREFSACFSEPGDGDAPKPMDMDIGPMLLDVAYADDRSGRGTPQFWPAILDRGVLRVPRPQEVA